MVTDEPSAHEIQIVWDEDVQGLDYVRELITPSTRTRREPIPWYGPGRRVGYSVLAPDAPNNGHRRRFTRRVFWVASCDRSESPSGPYAVECPPGAVDPRSIAPGEPSYAALGSANLRKDQP